MERFYKIVRAFLFLVAFALIVDSVVLLTSGINFSKTFSAIFGLIIIVLLQLYNVLRNSSQRSLFLAFRVAVLIFVLSVAVIESQIILVTTVKTGVSDVVIVLGAGLNGNKFSSVLKDRLDTAYSYLNTHPESYGLLSGGQGADETINEAIAMKNYLIQSGIPAYRLKTEEKSTDTLSNFVNSKAYIDNWMGKDSYSTAFITSNFHVFRAGLTAKKAGLDPKAIAAPTEWYIAPNYYIREYFAVIGFFLTGS